MIDVDRNQAERRLRRWMTASCVALVVITVLSLFLGVSAYSPAQLMRDPDARFVVFNIRLPRVLFSLLVGGGLAVVGIVYQALFRNPLASPFSLGVSSGGALGASLAILFGLDTMQYGLGVATSAVLASLVTMILVLKLARRGANRGATLLLIGVVFSFFSSSLLTLIQYLSDYSQLFRVTRWMMGGIMIVGVPELCVTAVLVICATAWIAVRHRDFDLMLFGDDLAATKGVDVDRLYRHSFIVTSIVVGWIVSQCGVIGFIGIVVPAAARIAVGSLHRRVIPLSFVLGAALVIACDLLGRSIAPPYEIPVGVFTSVIGGPTFVWLVLRYRAIRFG